MRAVVAGGVSVLIAAAAAGATSTAATWLAPVALSADGVFAPDVAVNERGDAVVAWQRVADRRIVARFRAAGGGGWGKPHALGLGSAGLTRPGVAIDPAGNAVVAWRISDPPAYSSVTAAYRPAAGRWQQNVQLSSEGAVDEPLVVMDDDGAATAAWLRVDADSGYRLETAYRPSGGSWGQPTEIARTRSITGIDLAVGAEGVVLLSWAVGWDETVVHAALGRRGSWQPPLDLARGRSSYDTSAAVGPGGRAAVGWSSTEHGNSITRAAVLPAGSSTWSSANLSFEDGQAGSPELAIDGNGNVTAVWATNVDFEASYLPVGADAWYRPVAISGPRSYPGAPSNVLVAGPLSLDVNRRGDAIAIWNTSGVRGGIVATTRSAGSLAWHPPATVSADDGWREHDGLELDGVGNALVVWTLLRDGYGDVARMAALDAAPPVLEVERAPSGHVGEPLVFRAHAFDIWSPLAGPIRWSFGDGGSGFGTIVRHVFRAPGEYRITLEATDALGNVARAVSTVRVEPATPVRNVARPVVVGERSIGGRLDCRPGRWSGSPPLRLRYAWLREGRTIPGAARPRFRLRPRDAGAVLACRVTATNPAGTAVATSRAVRIAAG